MIDGVESATAKLCSFTRAFHSNFDNNKIFDDYLALDLMGAEEYEQIGSLIERDCKGTSHDCDPGFCESCVRAKLNRYLSPILLSRAAFAEEELRRFAQANGLCQYVICGAGMDTFAFRNGNSRIRIFEIVHPDTQRYKLEKISSLGWQIPAHVRYVSVDFSVDDMAKRLVAEGFDPSLPSFFAILGVTYYLTLPTFEDLLARIASISSPGSKVVFDFPDQTTFGDRASRRMRDLAQITATLGERMLHGYSISEVTDALAQQGFQFDEYATPGSIQRRYFDGRSDGQKAYENIHFVLAQREDERPGNCQRNT